MVPEDDADEHPRRACGRVDARAGRPHVPAATRMILGGRGDHKPPFGGSDLLLLGDSVLDALEQPWLRVWFPIPDCGSSVVADR